MARVVSGMRPTGGLHIGHLRGALQNWRRLQDDGEECFFFVADWHALTTDYASPEDLSERARTMVSAWVASGIDPAKAIVFRQSDVPAHAELCALLSMLCPLSWLEHLPTYKEQKAQMQRDLETLGFLSYPLLQSADIMIYAADGVPVGEDQLPHIEFAREIARRFNRLYGQTDSFQQKRAHTGTAIGKDADKSLRARRNAYIEKGDAESLQNGLRDIEELKIAETEKAVLRDDLLYGGEEILRPPQAYLTATPKLPGTDGRKMSKSYGNAVELFDTPDIVNKKIARMTTDPARKRRADPGEPANCPVWKLHEAFSDEETQTWAAAGCRSADIGCLDCKKRLCEFINAELSPILDRRAEAEKPGAAEAILADGAKRARLAADQTMQAVRRAMRVAA